MTSPTELLREWDDFCVMGSRIGQQNGKLPMAVMNAALRHPEWAQAWLATCAAALGPNFWATINLASDSIVEALPVEWSDA